MSYKNKVIIFKASNFTSTPRQGKTFKHEKLQLLKGQCFHRDFSGLLCIYLIKMHHLNKFLIKKTPLQLRSNCNDIKGS